jgi:hypothetical protein
MKSTATTSRAATVQKMSAVVMGKVSMGEGRNQG